MQAYKALYPDKAQGAIFGPEAIEERSGGKKDPDAMEIDKCYQWTVNVLSDHPRWIFKKNSIEFFIGLQPYLYYYYSGCTLESHNHMFFPECSMIT